MKLLVSIYTHTHTHTSELGQDLKYTSQYTWLSIKNLKRHFFKKMLEFI